MKKKPNLPESSKDTALIVHPVLPLSARGDSRSRTLEDQIEEIEGLARAIALDLAVDTQIIKVTRIAPGYLLGKGGREKIATLIDELEPGIVIVNHGLSPVQQRNLEREWKCKVIDRTGLILEIFGARAQTKEGRIQVELAALEYQKSRLVRSWTHLERQRGGAGFMGGPGETQLELDRRIITDKIGRLKKDLEKVRQTRSLGRQARERVPFPVVALAGYTNAGKSTLFNRLTGASVYAEDLPFATLDPTMRRLDLPDGQKAILSDTVGFIADLPTTLVAAFRGTLEQVDYADVILHVRDMSGPDSAAQKDNVVKVLGELGIEYDTDSRIIEVLNKADKLSAERRRDLKREASFHENQVVVSALTGNGIEDLLTLVSEKLGEVALSKIIDVPLTDGKAMAWLYQNSSVMKQTPRGNVMKMDVRISKAKFGQFNDKFNYKSK